MKRSLTLLLASLLVVFGLTACGGSDNQNSETNKDSAVVGDSSADNHDSTANNGTDSGKDSQSGTAESGTGQNGTNKGDSLMDDVEQGVDDAVQGTEDALDDMTGKARTRSALVHDRDGDLTDQENGVARNSTR